MLFTNFLPITLFPECSIDILFLTAMNSAAERSTKLSKVQTIVNVVLEQQKQLLATSTYEVRKNYLKHLASHADAKGITEPCQELYDSYVAKTDSLLPRNWSYLDYTFQ